jgi:cell division transport system permease protein
MRSFWRVVKFALQDLGRNLGLSLMTVCILILMLLSVNVLWSVDTITKEAVKLVKNQINVSLYFKPETTDKEVMEVKKYLDQFPEVTDLTAISREEVLAQFRQKHDLSSDVLSALDELGGNPFGQTLIVKTREPEDYARVMSALDVPEYENMIESKSFEGHEEGIDKIQNITNRVEKLGFGLSILFALISFMIIFNTVRVAIYTHRVEISIKRLVGASSWFIRGPYIVESVIFTIISVGLTAVIMFLALRWIDPYLAVVFTNGFNLTNYYNSNILTLFGLQAAAVLLLTILSSFLAMRRQLKV